jgi:hypothetical protein
VEPATDNILTQDVNQLYRTTACKDDYINPTANGMINWRSISIGGLYQPNMHIEMDWFKGKRAS